MKLDLVTLVILAFYLYTMVCVLKMSDQFEMLLLTVVLMLYLYIKNRQEKIEGNIVASAEVYAPAGGCKDNKCTDEEIKKPVNIIKKQDKLPKTKTNMPQRVHSDESDQMNLMSNYDALCLSTGNSDSWRKSPADIKLNSSNGLYTFQGSTGPVKPVFSDNSGLHGPPVDGQDNSDKSMFMLGYNKTSPECCPSTFSTSTGCVCSTHNQREYVKNRGNNAHGCNKN